MILDRTWAPIFLAAYLIVFHATSCSRRDAFPGPAGPYLGQTTPGGAPEIFAPGILSTGFDDIRCTFRPDGEECFYSVMVGYFETILWTRLEDGRWTEPEAAPFADRYYEGYPSFHPDGSKLYFHSFRPLDGGTEPSEKANIWIVHREGDGWGQPRPAGPAINGGGSVSGPSVTRDGTLYFAQWQEDGRELVMRSRYRDGAYQPPEALPPRVNASRSQFHFCIAPDESYLIVPLGGREDAIGEGMNYYVTFRSEDDRWSELINLGDRVNSGKVGAFPSVSADGKYFFYQARPAVEFVTSRERVLDYSNMRQRLLTEPAHDRGAIYWVETGILEALKPGWMND